MSGISARGGTRIIGAHVATQFDKTNSTLADVPGLSVTLGVGTYAVRIEMSLSLSPGSGKIKLTGTLVQGGSNSTWLFDGDEGGGFGAQAIAFGSTLSLVTQAIGAPIPHTAVITGSITVATSGTLKVQFAQDSTNATASSVIDGSYMTATPIT